MTAQTNRRSLRCLLALAVPLLLAGGAAARGPFDWVQSKRPALLWSARLYAKDTSYVQVEMNPQNLLISGEVECEIKFFSGAGKPWTDKYKFKSSELRPNTVKTFWVKHGYRGVTSAEGVAARYDTRPYGTAFNNALPDLGQKLAALNCRDYKSKGLDAPPGTVRNDDGTFSPRKPYRWVSPGDPLNLCVELRPGLIRKADGTISPSPGYRWINPGGKDDFRVERVPR